MKTFREYVQEGSRIELINVQGGDAELWHAYIRSTDL